MTEPMSGQKLKDSDISDAKFPSDYMDLAHLGVPINGWKISDPTQIPSIIRSPNSLYKLAAKNQELIAVEAGECTGQLLIVDKESDQQRLVGENLRTACQNN